MERIMDLKEFEELVSDGKFLKEVGNWADEHREIINSEFEKCYKEFSSHNISDETIYSISTLGKYGEAKGIDFFPVILGICSQDMKAE